VSARAEEPVADLRDGPRAAPRTLIEIGRANRPTLTNDLQLARDQDRRR
jgi:hypothetical protein